LAASGCQKDDLMKDQGNGPGDGSIGVNVFVPRVSKGTALNNTGDLVNAGNGFDLFAFLQTDDGANGEQFMGTAENGVAFTGTDNGNGNISWNYTDKNEMKFWSEAQGTAIKFYAVSPMTEKTGSEQLTTGSLEKSITADVPTVTYTVPTDCGEQVDLMYAVTDSYTSGESDEHVKNGIELQFKHALSQIVFKAKTDSELVFADVQSVTIKNLHGAGIFRLEDGTWNFSDEATGSFAAAIEKTTNINTTFDEDNNELGTTTDANTYEYSDGTLTASTEALLLLPQDLQENGTVLKIMCRVRYQRAEDDIVNIVPTDGSNTYTEIEVPVTTKWEPGYKYTYTLVFTGDMGTPVKVQTVSVDEWCNATEEENEPPGEEDEGNPLLLNMKAADMFVGEIVLVEMQATSKSGATLSLSSGDEQIARITEDGGIEAVGQGKTTVFVSCEGYDDAEVEINVLPTFLPVELTTPIKTVLLQAGSFSMGFDYENDHIEDAPQHSVTIKENFYLGQYEVTVGQFVEFLNGNPDVLEVVDEYEWEGVHYSKKAVVYTYEANGETCSVVLCELETNNITGDNIGSLTVSDENKDLPVRCSWEGAAAFARSVGGYLPHEEEWEYAARGGKSGQPFWWCDNFTIPDGDQRIYLADNNTYSSTQELKDAVLAYENMFIRHYDEGGEPVDGITLRKIGDTQKANAYGLYDLFGNVIEWCGNYGYNYEDGIQDEVNHMVRGCIPILDEYESNEYVVLHEYVGVAFRNNNTGMNETGFRVAFKADYSGTNQSVQTVAQE